MSMLGFEQLATNIEVMQSIFQLLNFEEQLKLAQVSVQLKRIFSDFILRFDYEKVCIIKHPPDFHVRTETNLKKLKLTDIEFKEFIKLYGCDIKELDEKCNPRLDLQKFPNLISLSYSYITVTKAQLESVAKYCKNIQNLTLYKCFNEGDYEVELIRDLQIKTVLEMRELKYLNLSSSSQLGLRYEYFRDLIIKTKIKHLILSYYVPVEEEEEELPPFDKETAISLEELEISVTFKEEWYGNFPYYLSLFENLNILKLFDADTIDDESIEVLAKTCKKLKILSIRYTELDQISNFNLLTTIEDLSLHKCVGLSHTNLRQILTEMNLLKFTSLQTEYKGEFENFPVSRKLEVLNIHELKTYTFKGAYEENNTLKSLVWYDDFYEPYLEPPILKCPHLEHLEIFSGFIASEIVLQLKSLISFTISSRAKTISLSYIVLLLRDHVSLREFTLEKLSLDLKEPTPKEAFKCAQNLKCVSITIRVFKMAIDFWLDLLNKNPNLKLTCSGLAHPDVVRNLIKSTKFPHYMRVFYIDGVKVACKDLRQNVDLVMEKVKNVTNLPIVAYNVNKYGIVFN